MLDKYDNMIFLNKDLEEQWERIDPEIKNTIFKNLKHHTDKMSLRLSIDTIACVISDFSKKLNEQEKRIKTLEEDVMKLISVQKSVD